jgi:hypothetical protein
VVSVLATGPKVHGFDPDRGRWVFKGDKNQEHQFLRRGSKAVGSMSHVVDLRHARKQNSAAISHPSLLTDCQMALAVTSGLSRRARPVSWSLTATNAQDQATSERGGPSPYRAVELWLLLLLLLLLSNTKRRKWGIRLFVRPSPSASLKLPSMSE